MSKKTNQTTDDLGTDLLKMALKSFNISEENAQLIIGKFKPVKIKRGETFCKKGEVSNKLGIIISGFLYSTYEYKSNEIVSRFFYRSPQFNPYDNFIVTSFKSFTEQSKSDEAIIALEDSYLRCISHNDIQELYKTIPEMNYIGRVLAELSYIKALQRIHLLQIQSHKERLLSFYEQQPIILGKASVQHLTSYLAMNRNTLARTQKELKLKK